MTEEIKGIAIEDYNDICLNGLTEIQALDIQLINYLTDYINHYRLPKTTMALQILLEDTKSHADYVQSVIDYKLADMEYQESTTRLDYTPCDDPDFGCPYDAQGSDDCRRYCGLGVDE